MLYLGGSILGIAIIAFVIVYFVYGNNLDKQNSKIDTEKLASLVQNTTDNEKSEETSSQMGKTVEESKNDTQVNQIQNTTSSNTTSPKDTKQSSGSNSVNTNTTQKVKEQTNKTTKKEENKQEEAKTENKQEQTSFIKPVEGEIVKAFAKDNLLYSETLGEWTTHLGIDIKAEKTTVVKAACAGKVKSIKNDPRYGLSIIIEHADEYETLYSNLLTSEFVQVGDEVKQGQTIGTVGNTATFEIADEAHLHFEITKNGEKMDPNIFIK